MSEPRWETPSYPVTDEPPAQRGPRYTTHPKVVIGVVLIASLMLFNVFFGVLISISWAISSPEAELIGTRLYEPGIADYFGFGRVLLVAGLSAILTWVFWKAASAEYK